MTSRKRISISTVPERDLSFSTNPTFGPAGPQLGYRRQTTNTVNVNNSEFPYELRRHATSLLLESGREVNTIDLLCSVLHVFFPIVEHAHNGGIEELLANWEEAAAMNGRNVKLKGEFGELYGVVKGINRKNGSLLLRVDDELVVRCRQPGDRFKPLGMSQTKKLGEYMIDAKIPRTWRQRVPIVCSSEHVLWLVGWRIDDRAKVTENTEQVLRLEFECVSDTNGEELTEK